MEYADLTELGNEAAVKAAGKYRQKGKDYVVQVSGWYGWHASVKNAEAHGVHAPRC
jgi:ribosome-binding ATPase YchF (GTP1/OBG family)